MRAIRERRLLLLLVSVLGTVLGVPAQGAAPAWDMTGTYTICFTIQPTVPASDCSNGYLHDLRITSMDMLSGEFAGDGSWPAGAYPPTYTWPIEGKVAGSDIYFELAYNELAGHLLTATGTIDAGGVASGTALQPPYSGPLNWVIAPAAHFKTWDGALRSMGYFKQPANRLTGTITAYVSSCTTKDVSAIGPGSPGPAAVAQTFTVLPSQSYKVTSVGTYFANDGIYADAKYSSRNDGPWQDDVQNYESYGPDLLDLRVDFESTVYGSGTSPNWGMYNPMHSYTVSYTSGSHTILSMGINDIYAVNNSGSLEVTVCGPSEPVSVSADAVWAAFGAYSSSPWNKFLAQYGVTVFNLSFDPALGLAVFWKPGNAFSGKTVSELVLIGKTYTTATPPAALLALKDVFDWINNRMYLYY